MKTSSDPRHRERIDRVQALFASSYGTSAHSPVPTELQERLVEIDSKISAAAPERPLKEISRIDLAILRNAAYELLYQKETPSKVVIDEAVEIGKTYGSESTPSFVNGVLGTILKSL